MEGTTLIPTQPKTSLVFLAATSHAVSTHHVLDPYHSNIGSQSMLKQSALVGWIFGTKVQNFTLTFNDQPIISVH